VSYRDGAELTVLAVCTGNVCRSPAVERLLRQAFGPGSGIRVVSAGTGALVGEPIHPPMAALLREAGADAEDFAARGLTEDLVRRGDLVLALTREHRGDVVELAPAAVRRTFTLRELARLAERVDPGALDAAAGPGATPAARLAALLPLAAAQRSAVPAEQDDVVDPYRQDAAVYRRSFDQITPAVAAIARRIQRN
jgi:protein-tyrosine phosphatase